MSWGIRHLAVCRLKPVGFVMRVVVLLFLNALAVTALAQGEISIFNGSYAPVRTNSVGVGGGAGNTEPIRGNYYYGLFIAASTVTSLSATDLLTPTWTFTTAYATNTSNPSGGLLTGGCVQVPGWDTTTNAYVLAGWSANIGGSDWASVAFQLSGALLNNGVWSGPNWLPSSQGGFFGVSMVGIGGAPDPVLALPCFDLFGTTPNDWIISPISAGWDLFTVNTPEPSSRNLFLLGILVPLALGPIVRRRRRALGVIGGLDSTKYGPER